MKIKSGWRIEKITDSANKSYSIVINKPFGIFLIMILVILIFIIISTFFHVFHNQYKISSAETVMEENRVLKEKLTEISAQMDSISIKLQTMEAWEDEFRAEQNLKKVNKEIRKMGVGGILQVDSTFIHHSPVLHAYYNILLQRINQLNSRVDFSYKTRYEVLENMQLKEALFRNTPSIYPAFGRITETFGTRMHPITNIKTFHFGIDIANLQGTPIYATADGIVESIGKEQNYGKFILLKHQFGYETKYAHLHKIFVAEGHKISRGDIIGTMGNTGRSTGAHLHYEVIRYNKHRNPYQYLNTSKEDIVLSKQ
jgi:hypothetical protein